MSTATPTAEQVVVVVVERSYLVRVTQTYTGTLPPQWDSMNDGDRDQYVCDHFTLTSDDQIAQLDDSELRATVRRADGTAEVIW